MNRLAQLSCALLGLASTAAAADPLEGYLFAYFKNDTAIGQSIYFAASDGNNILNFTELYNGAPVLRSTQGTKGLRDPFIVRSHDGSTFWAIATDLNAENVDWSAASRTGSRYLEIWESSDLINWSDQRHVLVSPETAGNTWAPEAYWDDDLGKYVVYWASALFDEDDTDHSGALYQRMMYATTSDFSTFSEAQVWQDGNTSRIDTSVLEEDGVYYRFTKDDGGKITGCTDIIQEKSTNLTAELGGWTSMDTCIGKKAGTEVVEGAEIVKANPDDVNGEAFYLFVDEYHGRHYVPLVTADISKPDWAIAADYNLPFKPRHGTILPITAAELKALQADSDN